MASPDRLVFIPDHELYARVEHDFVSLLEEQGEAVTVEQVGMIVTNNIALLGHEAGYFSLRSQVSENGPKPKSDMQWLDYLQAISRGGK